MRRFREFHFRAQRHENAHITVPWAVREELNLGVDGPVHLDIWTAYGHIHGDFEMKSNGEVYASSRPDDPNRLLVGVVPAGAEGFAVASAVEPVPTSRPSF
jgi:hypothetical protein